MNRISLTLATVGVALVLGCTRTGSSEMEPTALPQSERLTVRSTDGTRIGFTRIGSGPVSVVIVHGALNSGEQWIPVATEMAEYCTCYVMDRWGRGGSEDHADYSLEREVDDIGAVLEAAGPGAFLVGHSSGAIYTLEAARRYPVAGLVVFEPPLHAFQGRFADDILPRIRTAAGEERYEDAVTIFLRDEAAIPEDALSDLKQTPLWKHMVSLAPHSVREWEELVEVKPAVERYRDVAVPTLLLAGTVTESHPSFATKALQSTLPDARIVMLEGQGHSAHRTAPEMLAQAIVDFVRETVR